VVGQLLNNSDDEMDTEDEDSDGFEESKGEGDGKKEEEAAQESVSGLLSAQADITLGEVADQNEFPMMHKFECADQVSAKNNQTLWYLLKTQPEDGTRLTSSFNYEMALVILDFFLVPKGVYFKRSVSERNEQCR
jgi:hypothetical protein